MNYSVFDIENVLNKLDRILKDTNFMKKAYNNLDYQLTNEGRVYFDTEVAEIQKKGTICRDLLKVQKVENAKFQIDLDATSIIVQLLFEIEKYINKNTLNIIVDHIISDITNISISEFNKLNQGKIFYSVLHNIVVYYLSIHKEILYLSNQSLAIGCYGRYRVLLEIYSIMKYFIKHQNCIFRFFEHQIVRDYIINEKWDIKATTEGRNIFDLIEEKYKSEFKTFKMNYGWAGKHIKNHNSIKEIIQLAFDDETEMIFIQKEYDLLSEYSHVSSYVINNLKNITNGHINRILLKSNELSLYMIQVYLKFLLSKTSYKEKPIAYILPLINILHDKMFPK
jgi:hypothetical protein